MPNLKHRNTIFYDTIWHHPVICGEFKTIIGLKIISWHVEPMLSVSVTPQLSAKPKKSFYNLLKLVTGWHLHPDGCLGNWLWKKYDLLKFTIGNRLANLHSDGWAGNWL